MVSTDSNSEGFGDLWPKLNENEILSIAAKLGLADREDRRYSRSLGKLIPAADETPCSEASCYPGRTLSQASPGGTAGQVTGLRLESYLRTMDLLGDDYGQVALATTLLGDG